MMLHISTGMQGPEETVVVESIFHNKASDVDTQIEDPSQLLSRLTHAWCAFASRTCVMSWYAVKLLHLNK
jgi:hypothetical protein